MAHCFTLISLVLIAVVDGETIRCFECAQLPLSVPCAHVTVCGSGQQCMVETYTSTSGSTLYNSGCASSTTCGRIRRHGAASSSDVFKRVEDGVFACTTCCHGELCNNQGCGVTALSPTYRGPMCFQCNYQDAPDECRYVRQCRIGEVCMLTEYTTTSSHGKPLYQSTCIRHDDCLIRTLPIIGRRRSEYCHTCCAHDFCNDRCLNKAGVYVAPSTIMPTTVTIRHTTALALMDRCTSHHYTYDQTSGLCYSVHHHERSWDSAEQRCIQDHANLAVIDTREKIDFLHQLLKHGSSVYIGGRYAGHHDGYQWITGAGLNANGWAPHQPSHGNHECVIAKHDGWHDVGCDDEYGFICSIE